MPTGLRMRAQPACSCPARVLPRVDLACVSDRPVWSRPARFAAGIGARSRYHGVRLGSSFSHLATSVAFTRLILTAGLLERPAAITADTSAASNGEALFGRACSTCHRPRSPRAPSPEVLRGRHAAGDPRRADRRLDGIPGARAQRRRASRGRRISHRPQAARHARRHYGRLVRQTNAAGGSGSPARCGTGGDPQSRTRISSRRRRRV